MLVTFRTSSYADITLFGEEAIRLLRMMGHSGTVPGALLAADVPAALARLRNAIAAQGEVDAAPGVEPEGDGGDDDDDEPAEEPVSLAHRAFTLIELLEAAARDGNNVMWDAG